MLAIQCKVCGGDIELAPHEEIGMCAYCGNANTFPKTEDEERIMRFNRANNLRRKGEFDKALAIYEEMLEADQNDAELHWCCALARFGVVYHEDPVSFEWVPECNRTSVENFLEDADYLAAINGFQGIERRRCQQDAEKIADAENEIRQIAQGEAPYDLFISCKNTDDKGNRTEEGRQAQSVYNYLERRGYRVFFAPETLAGKDKSEPYVYAALKTAKAMVVFGGDKETLEDPWIKNEIFRFDQLSIKKKVKSVVVCSQGVGKEDLPGLLKGAAVLDMGEEDFQKNLFTELNKVMNKKIPIDAVPMPSIVKEQVSEESEAAPVMPDNRIDSNESQQEPMKDIFPELEPMKKEPEPEPEPEVSIEELLQQGNDALLSQKWDAAQRIFEEVLIREPENGRASFGQYLAAGEFTDDKNFAQRISMKMDSMPEQQIPFSCDIDKEIAEAVEKYQIPHYFEADEIAGMLKFSESYTSCVQVQEEYFEKVKSVFNADGRLIRACSDERNNFGSMMSTYLQNILNNLLLSLDGSKEKDKKSLARIQQRYEKHLREKLAEIESRNREEFTRRDNEYMDACSRMTEAKSSEEFVQLIQIFTDLSGYKNADQFRTHCENKVANAEKVGRKKTKKRALFVVLGAVAAVAVLAVIFLPKYLRYQNAVGLYDKGDFEGAIAAFQELGSYRSSEKKMMESVDKQIEKLKSDKAFDKAEELIKSSYSDQWEQDSRLQKCYETEAEVLEANTATNVATLEGLRDKLVDEKAKESIEEKLDEYNYEMGNKSAQGGNFNTALEYYDKVGANKEAEAGEMKAVIDKAMKQPLYKYVEGVVWKLSSCVHNGKKQSKDATGFAGVHAKLEEESVVFYLTFDGKDVYLKNGGSTSKIQAKTEGGAKYTLDFKGKDLTIKGTDQSGKAVVSQLRCK